MDFVKYNQHEVAYSREGNGPALLLLHGFCEDSSVWESFFEKRTKKYEVIKIDLPGFGESDVQESASIDSMADCVKAVIDDLNIQQCTLIGHSMGGYVTLAFAKKYPEYLNGIGLFHSHPFADSNENRKNRERSIHFMQRFGHVLFVKQLIPKLFSETFLKNNQLTIEKLSYTASRFKVEGIITAQKAMMLRPDQTKVLQTFKKPVLFILGSLDPIMNLETMLEQTHLPNIASIHVLEKAGHMGMFESPQKCRQIVNDFVEFCLE